MNRLDRFITPLALILIMSLAACKKDNTGPGVEDSFEAVIESGGGFAEPSKSTEILDASSYEEVIDGTTWTCTTETLDIKDGAGGKDGFPLFSPNSSVIYPGNMLQGNSLNSATPKIIAVERAAGTISTDVVDGNIQSTFQVDAISKSEVINAINNIINTSTGVVPANFSFRYENVQSREQFALSAGVDVNTTFYELEANVSFSTDKAYNRFLVTLNQSYYTMSFDIPTSLDKLFDASVTPADLAKYVGPGNPATYISDVTYGRIFYMLIESTSSRTEMDAAIAASFNGIGTSVDGYVETNFLQDLDELKIQVYAFGGEASSTLQTIGETNLSTLVDLLAESSQITTGKPISYVVRSVYDNQIVSTQLATKYDVTNCTPSGPNGAPPYTEHWTGKVISTMGPVGAAYNTYGNEFILISKDGTQFLRSNVGDLEGPFSIDALGTTPCTFDAIGAACNLDGNQYGDFYLMAFDASGTQYAYMNPSGVWSSDPQPISNLAYGTCPFNITGVGAMAFNFKDPDGPSGRFMFNRPGDKYSYYLNNPQGFDPVYNTWQWGPDYSLPFEKIGAAIGFYIGDDKFFILFNDLGTKYCVYGNVFGTGSPGVLGPFDL
ncbi:MAG: thiol-activated cytolysin family protein [Saprospiraceae bacterium]|nr:thiol-activated cytolysin family protein [Saprospiraceae bacterium]